MKYIPSIAFEEMSGSAKGVTAAKVRGRKYIRNRGYGGGFKTAAQSYLQAALARLEGSYQRADSCVELFGEHAEGQVCSRHVEQDFRSEPLFEAELMDRKGGRCGTFHSTGSCGSRSAL